ncbi:subunit Ies6 of Ino80 complex [Mitosporidium daphniae]|uniref:Subunit Ies6 of Ino80 complex n=1 Tax=Mitosporidium daphniae TaxID=1485682 RepID=A0A098VQ78_9MICR|nr:subunit Ies6 of Ino80 complex [Mitosporidium daphniae]KGG50934.1 subunit Ies6 of Ino80 complex [Mitosporidium daphniae]|eukprot:XP_013237361.1 subunit Ies6 of Ino80 complex [Mitosporidium daphniae]
MPGLTAQFGPIRSMVILSKRGSSSNPKNAAQQAPLLQNGLFDAHNTKPFKNPQWNSFIGSKRKWKSIKSLSSTSTSDPLCSPWGSMDVLPSLLPQLKYCDITGLEMAYVDPRSTLRYSSVDAYQVIKKLSQSQIQDYLALRNASFVMK